MGVQSQGVLPRAWGQSAIVRHVAGGQEKIGAGYDVGCCDDLVVRVTLTKEIIQGFIEGRSLAFCLQLELMVAEYVRKASFAEVVRGGC